MALIRLKWSHQNSTLSQQICQSCDMSRIKQVDFEKVTIANMIAIEWGAPYKLDMGYIDVWLLPCGPAVTNRQSMINC